MSRRTRVAGPRRRSRLASALAVRPSFAKPPTLTGLFPAGAARGQTVDRHGVRDVRPLAGEGLGRGRGRRRSRPSRRRGSLTIRGRRRRRAGPPLGPAPRRGGGDRAPAVRRRHAPRGRRGRAERRPEAPAASRRRRPRSTAAWRRRATWTGSPSPCAGARRSSADLEANRHLGSPMDAVLQVVSPDGFVLAQNDDAVGRDPRIVFEAPADGTYIVRLFAFPAKPDSSIRFAGGESFVYRLTLTTGGFLDHAFPLAVSRDGPAAVDAVGPNIPEAARLLTVSGDEGRRRSGASGTRSWPGPPRSAASPARRRSRPSRTTRPARRRSPTAARSAAGSTRRATGTPSASRCKKGDKRVFRVESRALGLPLDPVLRVTRRRRQGPRRVGRRRRKAATPSVAFTAPADGDYRVIVRDLNGRGGPRFAYLLRVLAPEPDFALSLAADRFDADAREADERDRDGRPQGRLLRPDRGRRRGPARRRLGEPRRSRSPATPRPSR